jgi:hypothetical protein
VHYHLKHGHVEPTGIVHARTSIGLRKPPVCEEMVDADVLFGKHVSFERNCKMHIPDVAMVH